MTQRLSDRQNERVLDRIEQAERNDPHCACGAQMVAVAKDGKLRLECSDSRVSTKGVFGAFSRLATRLSHSSVWIMDLHAPATRHHS
jgi:hypothetical protein